MAVSKEAVRWLIEATSEPDAHRLGDWVLVKKAPMDIIKKFHKGLIIDWLQSYQADPDKDVLGPWIGEKTIRDELVKLIQDDGSKSGGKAGGFGVTLPVEKQLSFNRNEFYLAGQAKFYFESGNQAFAAEAELANLSDLNSRLIPNLYGWGVTHGSHQMPYVIMERIEGYDLTSNSFKPLTASEFKTMAIDTLRALKYAKDKNVAHTDIKPANIMYSFDDTYVIVDFGITKILKRREVEGRVGGTEGYRAPEAFSEINSYKSDIYSLGLTFYYALTGKQPVAEALEKHWEQRGFAGRKEYIVREGEYQQLLKDLKFDFDVLTDDQAHLIREMLQLDFAKRLDVSEALGLASQLQVGTKVFEAEAHNPWIQLLKTVENQLTQNGFSSFRIAVREAKHAGLWIKISTDNESVRLVCSRPKNPIGLSQLGWRNSGTGLMELNLESSASHLQVAEWIIASLNKGYSIEPPWTITFS
jgi:serine/threonine protein kinase